MRNTCLCIPHGHFLSAESVQIGRFQAKSHEINKFIMETSERGRD